jgi:hypothetical protein
MKRVNWKINKKGCNGICHYMEKYLWILTNFTLVRSADAVVKTESSRS